jgi:hypothetical protein
MSPVGLLQPVDLLLDFPYYTQKVAIVGFDYNFAEICQSGFEILTQNGLTPRHMPHIVFPREGTLLLQSLSSLFSIIPSFSVPSAALLLDLVSILVLCRTPVSLAWVL